MANVDLESMASGACLPVETLIHDQQSEYYQVLRACDQQSDCTEFISFMLDKLIGALSEGLAISRG